MSTPTPLVYEAFSGGPLGALVVVAGLLVLAWYAVWGDALYVRATEALTSWWDRRREARRAEYVEQVVTAAEVAGVVPFVDPWADVLEVLRVDPFLEQAIAEDAATPVVDEDDCPRCFGTGMVEIRTGLHGEQWITCSRCDGSGERVA